MNGAHWHLLVNHLPIIFPIAGIVTLVIGLITRNTGVQRTALLLFVVGALGAAMSMATGEGAEDVVKKLDLNAGEYIHEHEETAELFAILSYLLGALSITSLWAGWKQKAFARLLCIGTLVFALIVLFFAQRTGTTGGEIRHTEIRDASGQ